MDFLSFSRFLIHMKELQNASKLVSILVVVVVVVVCEWIMIAQGKKWGPSKETRRLESLLEKFSS
jgi:hypothetical protein